MSQSVNRGEKPAASEAAADAVEPVEAAVPAESVEPAEDAAAVEERMLVCCFSRTTLTSMSSPRGFSPTTCPS